jgi:4-amino-4-deoxy-L-arabinose transferase-like glycosyltransferase
MVYATIPAVLLFGKSEAAARLPSAVFGVLTIIALLALVYELTKSKPAALWSAFFLAIQPWHVNFSRQLFESNGATFWFVLGTYFLAKTRHTYTNIYGAGLSYVIALYFYYSVRLVIPIVGIVFILTNYKNMQKHWKTTLLAAALCFAAFLPLGIHMLSPGGLERISIVSVVNDPNFIKRKDAYVQTIAANPTVLNKIIYNRRIALVQTVIENYWKNISPRNLFTTGTGTYGALYPFDAILIVLGLIALRHLAPFAIWIIGAWLFSGFLPGAFSVNQPNTLRTLVVAPAFAVLSGLGMWFALQTTSKWKPSKIYIPLALIVALTIAFPKFLSAYFIDNPTNNAIGFADGNKQMVDYVETHKAEHDRIYVSGYYWRPYIFTLYWGNIAPVDYQKHGSREQIDTLSFTSAAWDTSGIKLMDAAVDITKLSHTDTTLFILSPAEFAIHQKHLIKIDQINGRIASEVFIVATMK